eukprot:m.40490 g.40490  ORF g.40490 m.40490 type:complete len:233 (+) comp9667_c0_seq1:138-836(+)
MGLHKGRRDSTNSNTSNENPEKYPSIEIISNIETNLDTRQQKNRQQKNTLGRKYEEEKYISTKDGIDVFTVSSTQTSVADSTQVEHAETVEKGWLQNDEGEISDALKKKLREALMFTDLAYARDHINNEEDPWLNSLEDGIICWHSVYQTSTCAENVRQCTEELNDPSNDFQVKAYKSEKHGLFKGSQEECFLIVVRVDEEHKPTPTGEKVMVIMSFRGTDQPAEWIQSPLL